MWRSPILCRWLQSVRPSPVIKFAMNSSRGHSPKSCRTSCKISEREGAFDLGPLKGVTIIEMPDIGPGPFCAMLLADMGADVIRIDRIGGSDLGVPSTKSTDFVARNRRSIALDLKQPQAIEIVLRLIEHADALVEGFRPKVMERLGLGPDTCLQRNPRLVYGRMTGFGQEGPLSQAAGHDINYIALTGALASIGALGSTREPGPKAGAAAQSDRRLWWRIALSRDRNSRRHRQCARDGAGRRRRRSDGRWRGIPDDDLLQLESLRALARRARRQHPGRRRAVVRHIRDARRALSRNRCDRGEILPGTGAAHRPQWPRYKPPARSRILACAARQDDHDLQ